MRDKTDIIKVSKEALIDANKEVGLQANAEKLSTSCLVRM